MTKMTKNGPKNEPLWAFLPFSGKIGGFREKDEKSTEKGGKQKVI
jgi:hypothetical protein